MPNRQIVLDTETTGLEPSQGHRIIEIGCIELLDRKLTQNHFHVYLNPERDIEEGAVKVHGITAEFLADKPLFKDIIAELLNYLGNAELIIHNAPFDVGFLNAEMAKIGAQFGTLTDYCTITDTLTLARTMHPGQRNSLDALCKRYQVDNTQRDLHGAWLDAKLLAQVYLAMTSGQVNLFGQNSLNPVATAKPTQNDQPALAHTTLSDGLILPTLLPTPEEEAEHAKRIAAIANSSGQATLWQQWAQLKETP